jgi:hypothetical protein
MWWAASLKNCAFTPIDCFRLPSFFRLARDRLRAISALRLASLEPVDCHKHRPRHDGGGDQHKKLFEA